MNFKATDASIAALGGTCPGSDITARPVTARKAGPVALTLVAATLSIVLGGTTVAIAGVIEGRLEISGRSDLSPSSNLTGQRSKTDERHFVGWDYQPDATSRSGERRTGQQGAKSSERLVHNLGNPCAEKVLQDRPRQNNVSEPALVAGVGVHWQGTLTITGSNVRLGTEMPVALSSFCK